MVDMAVPDSQNYEFGDAPIPDNFLDQTMQKAMTQHSRKESQIASLQNDFQGIMDPNAAQNIAAHLVGFTHGQIESNNAITNTENTVQDTVDRVMKTHSRKVSQFESLKQELGLVFDEEEAIRIAKKTMKQINPNHSNPQQIDIDNIVSRARSEHKRKVSQFQAIKHDISQYFPDQHESTKLAAEIMKEYNPNDQSGKAQEISVESIVSNAIHNHKRKISTFRAVQNDLGLIFDDNDVKDITKDVMKKIFAQKQFAAENEQKRMQRQAKHERKESVKPPDLFGDQDSDSDGYMDDEAYGKRQQRANKSRKESVVTPNIFGDYEMDNDDMVANGMDQQNEIRRKIQDLQNELDEKDKQIANMKQQMDDLIQSKSNLVINSNQALHQMRGFLLQYQQSIFKTNS